MKGPWTPGGYLGTSKVSEAATAGHNELACPVAVLLVFILVQELQQAAALRLLIILP